MKGLWVTAKNELAILEMDEPVLGEYDALVEVYGCGICNSTDLKIIEGRLKQGTFPILLGHESSGKVVKTGKGVKHFRTGDTVLRARLYDKDITIPGGSSRFGGFSEKAVVTDVWARDGTDYGSFPHPQQVVPEYIDPAYAACMIMLKENLFCIRATGVRPGHSLAVVGTGPAAQAMVMWAKILGISPVAVFGRRPKWEERFLSLGADLYVTGDVFPGEALGILMGGGFDRTIEAVGSNDALARCLKITGPEGKINLYGMPPDDAPYAEDYTDDPRVFRTRIEEGAVHDELVSYIEEGRVDLEKWVSAVIDWNEYGSAFDYVRNEKPTKVILSLK